MLVIFRLAILRIQGQQLQAMLSVARYFRFGAWASSNATSSELSKTGRYSGIGIQTMRSPNPSWSRLVLKENRSVLLAKSLREQLAPSEAELVAPEVFRQR